MASDLATAAAPDWGLVLQSGLAGAAVVALFWAGLYAMEPARRRHRKRNPPHRHRRSTHVQSLLFSRRSWSPSRARAWARSHGYRSSKVDVTDHYVRLRQAPPDKFRVLRTVTFGRGIQAVVGR